MSLNVTQAFEELLRRLELTEDQTTTASTRQTELRELLGARLKLDGRPTLIGSYGRQTQVRMERDIDILAVFDLRSNWRTYAGSSRKLLSDVRTVLDTRYPRTRISSSGGAIVLEMSVFNVDVVPVLPDDDGFVLADGEDGWKRTNPLYHAELMTKHNKADPRLKPLVKLLKAWNITNEVGLGSFHLEMAVERAWRERTIPPYPEAVAATLRSLAELLAAGPLMDPWEGSTDRLDNYGWLERLQLRWTAGSAAGKAEDAERKRNAGDDPGALKKWRQLFQNLFPASSG